MEYVQVYDGIGEGLPPEIIAIIEENKKLKNQVSVLRDLDEENRRLRLEISDLEEYVARISENTDSMEVNKNGHRISSGL
jgi:regulator of replication initiation timing